MKKLFKLYLTFFVILELISCSGPSAKFKEPQPEDGKNSKSFPKKMIGEYMSNRDSSKLMITASSIIREYNYPFEMPAKFADTSKIFILKGDSITDKSSNITIYVKKENDTLKGNFYAKEELFSISQKNIARKFNGKVFLNFNHGDDENENWEVWEMEYKKGKLWIGKIEKKEDMDKLQKLTKTPADTNANLVQSFEPTRRQLRRFIKQDGFSDKEEFVKTN